MKQWLWTKIVTSVSGNGRHFNIIVKLFISVEKCLRRRQIVKVIATMRQQMTYEHKSTKMQQDRRHVACSTQSRVSIPGHRILFPLYANTNYI